MLFLSNTPSDPPAGFTGYFDWVGYLGGVDSFGGDSTCLEAVLFERD